MNYEGIEYVIRAGLGRNEWTIVILGSCQDGVSRKKGPPSSKALRPAVFDKAAIITGE